MKEEICRIPLKDIIWKKSLCPCVLSSENINKLKQSSQQIFHLTWTSGKHLVWQEVWAVQCPSSSTLQHVGALPAALARPSCWSRKHGKGTGVHSLQSSVLGASSLQNSEKPKPFDMVCWLQTLFPEENLGQDTKCNIICFSPTGQDGLNSLTLICRRCKESMVPPSFPLQSGLQALLCSFAVL